MENTCKNCFFWKQRKNEVKIGICFKANSGNKKPTNGVKQPNERGIVIRYPELDEAPEVDVFFGQNFGCIYFSKD